VEPRRFLGPYLRAVLRHRPWLALSAVGAVGGLTALSGSFDVVAWLWWLLLVIGLVVAQFLAYVDTARELAVMRSLVKELDSPLARWAFLDDGLRELDRFREELRDDITSERAWKSDTRFLADFQHWEDGYRATLRKHFSSGTDRRFDGDDAPDDFTRAAMVSYMDRLRGRLEEIRDET